MRDRPWIYSDGRRTRLGEELAVDPPRGTKDAAGLVAEVYGELRRIAGAYLRRERRGHTLQTTALVHEAYLRLNGEGRASWPDRAGFCAAAAQTIRRILTDHARARRRLKRGGTGRRVRLDPGMLAAAGESIDILALDEALQRLATLSPRQARIVELRYFGGLTDEEIAEMLAVSRRTVQSDWRGARAWLHRELSRGESASEGATRRGGSAGEGAL
jgi:RNA polymerase sigma-70 factor, ECF subfamily